jgi:hypothetical protein
MGVAVVEQSANSLIDPWLLGSKDENDVQGYAGTPVNVNVLTFEYHFDVQAAGSVFPRPKRYFISVDSGQDIFSGRPFSGQYVLRSWINDVRPPRIRILTHRVSTGRSMIAAIVTDRGAGVDPLSLVIAYRQVLVGAALYDPASGLALFPLPPAAPALRAGRTRTIFVASDFQESKNIDQASNNVMPNTAFKPTKLRVVRRPTVTWLLPRGRCVARTSSLAVAANAPRGIRFVRFFDGRRRVATVRRGLAGLYVSNSWRGRRGKHVLRAVAFTRGGRAAAATRRVRVCR